MKRQSLTFLLFFLASLGSSSTSAWAKKIYLNGVEITEMRNRTFKDVSVRLGPNGHVFITGKQYKVVRKTAQGAQPARRSLPARPKAPTKRTQTTFNKNYLLVFQRSGNEGSGYKINISINGKKIRALGLNVNQDIIQLNRYLHKGRNTLVIEALKLKKTAKGNVRILLSTGRMSNGRVFVNQPYILQYKRTSLETKSYRHIFPVRIQ